MGTLMQYAILILVAVSAVMAIASYFATRREVDDVKVRLVKLEDHASEMSGYVRREECSGLHAANTHEHENLCRKLSSVERAAATALSSEIKNLRDEWRADVKAMQATLGAFQEAIGKLKASSALQTAQLDRVDKKLDSIQMQRG
ncbi:MAG TPA: hypothetical protein PLL56_14425 [Verrucomicrobiota bacterium]|nr:hypothetical protein [Verrucomicrobiota bacterium]